jgi:hypothetical protein
MGAHPDSHLVENVVDDRHDVGCRKEGGIMKRSKEGGEGGFDDSMWWDLKVAVARVTADWKWKGVLEFGGSHSIVVGILHLRKTHAITFLVITHTLAYVLGQRILELGRRSMQQVIWAVLA